MSGKNIVKVEEHHVRDGETLEMIAHKAGITVEQLCKFNWGTDRAKEINKFLRSDVGSFKKSSDGKKFILSSKDDPGIIYIPKDVPEMSFSSNTTHTITVKKIHKKTFIPSKVMVQFRPLQNWNGKYGFDWMRINKDKSLFSMEKSYHDAYEEIVTGFKGMKGSGDDAEVLKYTGRQVDYKKLKAEYESIPTLLTDENEYFVPWLNLFSKKYSDNFHVKEHPPFEAELRIVINVKDEEPLLIDFEYNKNLIKLGLISITDKSVTSRRKLLAKTVKITCLEEFDSDLEIKVLAYPKTWKLDDPIPLAGKLIVCKNSNPKMLKVVLVRVKTDVRDLGVDTTGEIDGTGFSDEVERLRNGLFQGLIHGTLEVRPKLDLSDDPNFKIIRKRGRKIYGKYIYHDHHPRRQTHTDGGIYEDYKKKGKHDVGIQEYVRDKFINDPYNPGNSKYVDYFTVFAFGDIAYDFVITTKSDGTLKEEGTIGQVQHIGIKNVFMFGHRDSSTLCHEALHGIGLQHTHLDGEPEADRKHTFTKYKTDNIMSYESDVFSTWHWQWEIMNQNI
jgi:type VI secretion system secreted protein VgrG